MDESEIRKVHTSEDLRAIGAKPRDGNDPHTRSQDLLERFRSVPNHALFLYSSEDEVLSNYVKEHWAALDGLSGNVCDVYPSMLQLGGGEDAYTALPNLKGIPGLDAVSPPLLPILHIWSKTANISVSLRAIADDRVKLREALRISFGCLSETQGPMSAKTANTILTRVSQLNTSREPAMADHNYQPGLLERSTVVGAAVVIVGFVLFLCFRNEPLRDPNAVVMLRTVLSLATAALGATLPGFLHVGITGRGLSIRAGGALALFVLTFFFTPTVLPQLPSPNQPPTGSNSPPISVPLSSSSTRSTSPSTAEAPSTEADAANAKVEFFNAVNLITGAQSVPKNVKNIEEAVRNAELAGSKQDWRTARLL